MKNGQWVELLSNAEELTSTYLFWFDLHRHVATAMDRLGALFVDPRQVVGREVVGFLSRFPNTEKLCFSDGTPFADAATQTWLEDERAKHAAGAGAPSGPSQVNEEDAEVAKRFEEARELVTEGKIAEALSLASLLAMRGADARTRFRSRVAVAQMAVQGGQPEIGRPMLENLMAEADAHQLDEWEPQLCASTYAAYLSCARSAPGKAEPPEFRRVFDRLCRIDPALALKFAGV
jgi:type VI secretion system protein VasJ